VVLRWGTYFGRSVVSWRLTEMSIGDESLRLIEK
jgi:hypothetical protein